MRDHLDTSTNPIPIIRTRIGRLAYRLVPNERYRATLMLVLGGMIGYVAPQFVQALTDRARFQIEADAIDQLRVDSTFINCTQAQNVINQLIERNQEIRRKYSERQLWFTRPFVSPRWEQVQLLHIPCEVQNAQRTDQGTAQNSPR